MRPCMLYTAKIVSSTRLVFVLDSLWNSTVCACYFPRASLKPGGVWLQNWSYALCIGQELFAVMGAAQVTEVLFIWIVAEHSKLCISSVDNCTVASRTNLKLASFSPAVQSILKLSDCILSIAFLNITECPGFISNTHHPCCTAFWFQNSWNCITSV